MNPKITSQVDFRGKKVPARLYGDNYYLEVATKVALAHADAEKVTPGFSEFSHDFIHVGDKDVIRIGIEIAGKRFYGSAQIKWGGQGADKSDPVENAETSARGRALAAAGYEVGAMASAEDMERWAQSNGQTHIVESEPPALPDPALALPEGLEWAEWTARMAKSKGITDKNAFLAHLELATKRPRTATYTVSDYQKAVEYFYRLPDAKPVVIEQAHEEPTNV